MKPMKVFPDFATFFREIWGYDPFPWQSRLAAITNEGVWPEWITLPTGTGKTTAIDIAIYNLARQADRSLDKRTAPVRIIFAVNRRIVVDEAYERAKFIANRLKTSLENTEDALYPAAFALQTLSGVNKGSPLETYPLRGATFTDHSWARTPTQPLVISTTLDQLGSRLLFRGYGVSQNARPIHAALTANDALLILDEAHTAKAFSQTLVSVARFRRKATEPIALPFAAVQLTATPPGEVTQPFSLDENDYLHPVINARLSASKPAELVSVVEGAKGKARHKKMADAMADKAIAFLSEGHRRTLIVVNRVATAEALEARLNLAKSRSEHDGDVHLITGRLRPLDREHLIARLTSHYQLKSSVPTDDVPKLILIATQCIEVGADYDFDALLTELAPLDSMRQRFGRLNRQGRRIPAPAAIFAPEEALDAMKSDPLYGDCLPAVWAWLCLAKKERDRVNFGLNAIQEPIQCTRNIHQLLAPAPDAPILLESHLDLFSQTSPEPQVSPDPSFYIHGPGRSFAEISVVLRADISGNNNPLEILRTVSPIATESATVPLHHARAWLEKPADAGDFGGDASQETDERWSRGEVQISDAFRYSSGELYPLRNSNDLRNGDVLILPAQTPHDLLITLFPVPKLSKLWRLDQYEQAHLLSRDRLSIRFHTGIRDELLAHITDDALCSRFREVTAPLFAHDQEENRWVFREADWTAAIPELAAILAEHLSGDHPMKEVWKHAAILKDGVARPKADWKAIPYPQGTFDGVVFTNRSRAGATPWPLDPEDLGRQGNIDDQSISLAIHSDAVSKRAAINGKGLPDKLLQTLCNAGAWHDLGKLDPRFQALLHGCSLLAIGTKEPIAKSGRLSPAMETFYRSISELPQGFRHELLSALIVEQSVAISDHPEPDLLLHLIASHHGRCRAMAPIVHDPQPEAFDVTVDGASIRFAGQDCPFAHLSQGVATRFWSLTRRFGWWGLPYLESLLRLADQYESANPNRKDHS
jgi:CRISPR-associated endonuclease/helicase Cas3